MHVVLGSISIWTLYALVSCVSVSCLSMAKKVRWELVYDPMPNDESFDRFTAADHHATVNLIQQRDEQQRQRDEQQRQRDERQQWRYQEEQQQRHHHYQQQQQKRDEWQQRRGSNSDTRYAASEVCNCTEIPKIYNLTQNHYPKELMSVMCSGNWCKTASYHVPVLLKSNTQQSENQDDLPDELQQNVNHWKFDSVRIPVACYCSIK